MRRADLCGLSLRLAVSWPATHEWYRRYYVDLMKDIEAAPSIRLAHVPGAQGDRTLNVLNRDALPSLLVSYYYLDAFLKARPNYQFRSWVMDSGAFSAQNSGKKIDLQAYIECCKEMQARDPLLVEVFALDVIGDWRASLKNYEEMWRQGVEAIPCWHKGEPWDALMGLAKDYPKIALGGLVGTPAKAKRKIIEQAFARVWPKPIHGFGLCSQDLVLGFPFHTVDATNWELGPCAFGNWHTFGKLSLRGSKQPLRAEVEWHLKLEEDARRRWRREMERIGARTSN